MADEAGGDARAISRVFARAAALEGGSPGSDRRLVRAFRSMGRAAAAVYEIAHSAPDMDAGSRIRTVRQAIRRQKYVPYRSRDEHLVDTAMRGAANVLRACENLLAGRRPLAGIPVAKKRKPLTMPVPLL